MKMTDTPRVLLILLLLGAVGVGLCRLGPERMPEPGPRESWSGKTMGTTYQIQLAGVTLELEVLDGLTREVTRELLAVNQAMSTYIPESEISRFNAMEAEGGAFAISGRFQEVVRRSVEVYEDSGGAFDPTLGPLIDLWGFGAGEASEHPTEEEVKARLELVGLNQLVVEEGALRKTVPGMEINLSAIAKGYAVDRVMQLLREKGFEDIYVEIGGEVACRGVNDRGIPWRIGVQLPERDAAATVLRVVRLHNRALATSGDYRNYLEDDSMKRHHIIDPRTGFPADHTLTSVSVLAADCMTADAVATALYVMGTEEGMAWLSARPELDALFIDRTPDGFEFTVTPGFESAWIPVP